jgi:hypothetical protein
MPGQIWENRIGDILDIRGRGMIGYVDSVRGRAPGGWSRYGINTQRIAFARP